MANTGLIEKGCDAGIDNPTLELEPIIANLIYVRPKVIENESAERSHSTNMDQVPFSVPFDAPIMPGDNVDGSEADVLVESSSDDIEILELAATPLTSRITRPIQQPVEQNLPRIDTEEVPDSTTKKNSRKQQKQEFERRNSTNIFEDKYLFSDIIKSPNTDSDAINPRENLMKFLFSPPPKGVVVKCQLNNTNKKDKTMMFTKFIFSLQLSERDENQRKELLTLMAARSRKKTKNIHYIISTDPSEMKSNSPSIIGKMTGSLFGSQFRFYQNKRPLSAAKNSNNYNDGSEDNISEADSACSRSGTQHDQPIGVAFYKSMSSIKQKPRKMYAALPLWDDKAEVYSSDVSLPTDKNDLHTDHSDTYVLENIEPTYNKELNCFTLDFGGRAKKTSAKNFAFKLTIDGKEKRVYQFGKCRDHYIVDYTYPLCAFQAFAISLSNCQTTLGAK